MDQKNFSPETKVLAIEWYIPDNWYGSNRRVILTPTKEIGFKTSSESRSYISLLKKYVKDRFEVKGTPVFKTIEKCPTYIYCGAGPSYGCTNSYITIEDLEKFKDQYEKSEEFMEKKRRSEFNKWRKSWR
jgi:hypothetical protein